jgi:peptidoglycan/LPS O-acetylase OafA/YrhL
VIRFFLTFSRPTIYDYLEFFLIGFLLADLYLDKKLNIPKFISIPAGSILLLILLYVNHNHSLLVSFIYLLSVFSFYYLVLNEAFWKKCFSVQWITAIGGMCYSIYLIHSPITSVIGNFSHYYKITDYFLPNILINIVVCTVSSIIISAVFFKLIEQPCMDKNWHTKLAANFQKKFL